MRIRSFKAPDGKLAHTLELGRHTLVSDVGADLGGDDLGPDPHALFDASLAACTSLTVRMYARRKGIALEDIEVEIERDPEAEKTGAYRLKRVISLYGNLGDEERAKLLEIADKCPIHKLMRLQVEISTSLL